MPTSSGRRALQRSLRRVDPPRGLQEVTVGDPESPFGAGEGAVGGSGRSERWEQAPAEMGVPHLGLTQLTQRRHQIDHLDGLVEGRPFGEAASGEDERVLEQARVEAGGPLLDESEIAEMIPRGAVKATSRPLGRAGAFEHTYEASQLGVDPAHHSVVRGRDLAESSPVRSPHPYASRDAAMKPVSRTAHRDGRHVGAVVGRRSARLLDREGRVGGTQGGPTAPRDDRRSPFRATARPSGPSPRRRRRAARRLPTRSTCAPVQGVALGVGRGVATTDRLGGGRGEKAAEVAAALGDSWSEHVAAVPGDGDRVPGLPKDGAEVRFPRLQEVVQGPVSRYVRVPRRHDRHPARAADRVL